MDDPLEDGDRRQNGEQRQDANATDMIVNIPNLLSRASHVLPLRPGDVYTTGSPPGVGRIAPGDSVVVEAPKRATFLWLQYLQTTWRWSVRAPV